MCVSECVCVCVSIYESMFDSLCVSIFMIVLEKLTAFTRKIKSQQKC